MLIPSPGLSRAFLLIALGLGYVVCTLANKEKDALRKLGYVLGVSIIILSSLLIVGNLVLEVRVWCRRTGRLSQSPAMMRQQMPMVAPAPSQQK